MSFQDLTSASRAFCSASMQILNGSARPTPRLEMEFARVRQSFSISSFGRLLTACADVSTAVRGTRAARRKAVGLIMGRFPAMRRRGSFDDDEQTLDHTAKFSGCAVFAIG